MLKHRSEQKKEDSLRGMEVLFHHERNMLSVYSTYKIIKKNKQTSSCQLPLPTQYCLSYDTPREGFFEWSLHKNKIHYCDK
jgi:hypothetical protein